MTTTFDVTSLKEGKRSVLIVGRPRTYKTRFLASVPKPLWDYDVGNGALSLATDAKPGEITIHRFVTPKASKIGTVATRNPDMAPMEQFITKFNELYDLPKDKLPASVAIDDLSELANMSMEYVLAKNSRTAPQQSDWGMAQEKIREIVRAGLDLPCHFILIAHEKTEQDATSGKVWSLPAVYGQLAGEIARFFDDVFYAQPGKDKDGMPIPQFITVPKDTIQTAGSRFNFHLSRTGVVPANWQAIYGG